MNMMVVMVVVDFVVVNVQGWSKDKILIAPDDLFINAGIFDRRKRVRKNFLIKERDHICELCNNSQWLDELIVLELHHKDSDNTNNEKDNLQLLCPNCHSLTDGWRGRGTKRITISDSDYIKSNNGNIRKSLIDLGLRPDGDNFSRMKKLCR